MECVRQTRHEHGFGGYIHSRTVSSLKPPLLFSRSELMKVQTSKETSELTEDDYFAGVTNTVRPRKLRSKFLGIQRRFS